MRVRIMIIMLLVGVVYGSDEVLVYPDRDGGVVDRDIYGVTFELSALVSRAIEGISGYIDRLNSFDSLWYPELDEPNMDEINKLREFRAKVCRLMFEVGGGVDRNHMHRACYVGNDTWDKGGFDWKCWIGPPDSERYGDTCWEPLGPDTVIYVEYEVGDSIVSAEIYSPFDSTEEGILDKISSGEVLYADTAYRTRWLWHNGSDSLILPSHLPVERTLYDILEVVDSLGCVPEFVIFEVCDTFIDDVQLRLCTSV